MSMNIVKMWVIMVSGFQAGPIEEPQHIMCKPVTVTLLVMSGTFYFDMYLSAKLLILMGR